MTQGSYEYRRSTVDRVHATNGPGTVLERIPTLTYFVNGMPAPRVLFSEDGQNYEEFLLPVIGAAAVGKPTGLYSYESHGKKNYGVFIEDPDVITDYVNSGLTSDPPPIYFIDVSGAASADEIRNTIYPALEEVYPIDEKLIAGADVHLYQNKETTRGLTGDWMDYIFRDDSTDPFDRSVALMRFIESTYDLFLVNHDLLKNKSLEKVRRHWINLVSGSEYNIRASIDFKGFDPWKTCLETSVLQHIFLESLGNSVKYIDKDNQNPEIKATVERYDKENNPTLAFIISDSGLGMNRVDLEKICQEVGYRSPAVKEVGGTGNGLNIMFNFVKNAGGSMMILATDRSTGEVSAIQAGEECNQFLGDIEIANLLSLHSDKLVSGNIGTAIFIEMPATQALMDIQENPEKNQEP